MKKGILVLVLASICLTGCMESRKTSKCTMSQDTEGMGSFSREFVATFDASGENMKKLSARAHISLENSVSDDDVSTLYDNVLAECDSYKGYKGITCEVSKSNRVIIEELVMDFETLSKEDALLLNMDLDSLLSTNYEEWQESQASSGYTCY